MLCCFLWRIKKRNKNVKTESKCWQQIRCIECIWKVQSWSTHSSICRSCAVLQLACCIWGMTEPQILPAALWTTEHSQQSLASDLARCNPSTHPADKLVCSSSLIADQTDDLRESVRRWCCFCLSTHILIHVEGLEAQNGEAALLTLISIWPPVQCKRIWLSENHTSVCSGQKNHIAAEIITPFRPLFDERNEWSSGDTRP